MRNSTPILVERGFVFTLSLWVWLNPNPILLSSNRSHSTIVCNTLRHHHVTISARVIYYLSDSDLPAGFDRTSSVLLERPPSFRTGFRSPTPPHLVCFLVPHSSYRKVRLPCCIRFSVSSVRCTTTYFDVRKTTTTLKSTTLVITSSPTSPFTLGLVSRTSYDWFFESKVGHHNVWFVSLYDYWLYQSNRKIHKPPTKIPSDLVSKSTIRPTL